MQTPPLSSPTSVAAKTETERVAQAAERFEGLFIHQMLQQMRRSAEQLGGEDRMFKGNADNGLVSLADQMLADALASQRAFGVADAIVAQLLPTAPLKSQAPSAAFPQQTQGQAAQPPESEGKPRP